MTERLSARWFAGTFFAMTLLAFAPAMAKMSAEELAKLAQNPVGNLISIPFQNNTNLNFGPEEGTQPKRGPPSQCQTTGLRELYPESNLNTLSSFVRENAVAVALSSSQNFAMVSRPPGS